MSSIIPRHVRLEEAQNRLKQVERELKDSVPVIEAMTKRQAELKRELAALKNTIGSLTNKQLRVTDHAILRYLERGKKIDIDRIRIEIANKVISVAGEVIENGSVDVGGFVVENMNVVTFKGDRDILE